MPFSRDLPNTGGLKPAFLMSPALQAGSSPLAHLGLQQNLRSLGASVAYSCHSQCSWISLWRLKVLPDCDATNLQSIKGFKFSKEEERAEEEILMSQQWKCLTSVCTMWHEMESHGLAQILGGGVLLGQKGGHPAGSWCTGNACFMVREARGPQTSAPPVQKSYCLGSVDFPSAWG